jgi:enoyl-CoA hydratase
LTREVRWGVRSEDVIPTDKVRRLLPPAGGGQALPPVEGKQSLPGSVERLRVLYRRWRVQERTEEAMGSRFDHVKGGSPVSEPEPIPEGTILVQRHPRMVSIVLNRPRVLNSLNLDMIRTLDGVLGEVEREERFQFVLLSGGGDRGFCAGGDIRAIAEVVRQDSWARGVEILAEEYALCLRIHRFPKPVIALADGITMGAGLGLAAAANLAIATERTRMAMPETRIGFFVDVGATGWLFARCPRGYPEYLALTGYEVVGAEAVRVGFATHLTRLDRLPELKGLLEAYREDLPPNRSEAARKLVAACNRFFQREIPRRPDMDDWVATYFSGKTSMVNLMEDLTQCSIQSDLCDGVFHRLAERSPTSVVLTLGLLRHNEGRPLEQVFEADLKAARFVFSHPDFLEGVRARLIDKDDKPRWKPPTIEEVGDPDLEL